MLAHDKKQEYQLLMRTGLSADYLNEYMGYLSGLELLLVIDPKTEAALFQAKLQQTFQLLGAVKTYTEFVDATVPSRDRQLLINHSTHEKVCGLDDAARRLRCLAVSRERPSVLVDTALTEIERVIQVVHGNGERAGAYIGSIKKLVDVLSGLAGL